MTAATLRAATRADAPALADLARHCFAATYAPTHEATRIGIHCDTVLADAEVPAGDLRTVDVCGAGACATEPLSADQGTGTVAGCC